VVDGVQAIFFRVEHGRKSQIVVETVLTKRIIFFNQNKSGGV
jgi:hypothetical protein